MKIFKLKLALFLICFKNPRPLDVWAWILYFIFFLPFVAKAQVTEKWVARYGEGTTAHAIAVDASGNVYVTGGGSGSWGLGYAYVTIKYDTSGNEQWVARCDEGRTAYAIALDASGNVYITGSNYGERKWSYVTVKYDGNGNEQWVKTYNYKLFGGSDRAHALVLDASGNVYVTGQSLGYNDQKDDYATIKYDYNGNKQWVRMYNGPENGYDRAQALAVDASGNVYVTGESNESATYGDSATIKYDSNGKELWVARNIGGYNSLALDASANVYVAGGAKVIKYNSSGQEQWAKYCYSEKNTTLVLDASGNVYVAGWSYGDSVTVKYDNNGNELWVAKYNGPRNDNDIASALAVDASGNVYVTGDSNHEYATIKYTSRSSACPHDGNVNQDGSITPQDALMAFQHYLGIITLDDCQQDRADVNGDGSITPADALCIFQKYLGLLSCLDN